MGDRLRDKAIVVVGAGSVGPGWGNGKASAVLYAREGAKLYIADVNADAVEETRRLIVEEGGTCTAQSVDATDPDAMRDLMARCQETHGRIDGLHNNVGGSAPGGAEDMALEVWERQMDHNLKTAFLGCKYAIPIMREGGGGSIVNIASVAGMRYIGSDIAGYAASKGGLIQFSKAVALAHARENIRCNTVVPGLMHTPLVEARLVGERAGGDAEALIKSRHAQVPMGRMGDAWDVANAALFLLSDDARYITATEIVVDGGLTAKC